MIGGIGTAAGTKTLGEIATEAIGLNDGRLSDEMLRTEVATWEVDSRCHQLTMERVRDEMASTGVGNTSAMIKYYGTEMNKRRYELLMALGGSNVLQWEEGTDTQRWLRSKGNSIEGGTSEIQLNIISKRILGLG